MADDKRAEWQIILDAERKALAARTARLCAARLARDAALPPPAPTARRRRKKLA